MIKKILIPTDGSSNARKALDFAADLATKYDASLILLYVISESRIPEDVREFYKREALEEPDLDVYFQRISEKITQGMKRDIERRGIGDVEVQVVRGDPASEIIRFARERNIDMIVMGRRGLGSAGKLLLGSVSTKVCYLANCTCITVE